MSSDYEYTHMKRRFTVDTAASGGSVYVTAQPTSAPLHGMYIPSADVPTVALELLKAAGQESVIVPKSAADVSERPYGLLKCGNVTVNAETSAELIRVRAAENAAIAANYIALAEHIEGAAAREAVKKAEAEAAEKKLQARRDAVAAECAAGVFDSGVTYNACPEPLRTAIDRIIELEDGASRD